MTTDQLIIRPVANGFLVEKLTPHDCNTVTPDKDRYVFNSPSSLAEFIGDYYRPGESDNPKNFFEDYLKARKTTIPKETIQ